MRLMIWCSAVPIVLCNINISTPEGGDSGAAACAPIFVLYFFHSERENLESKYNIPKIYVGSL